MQQIISAPSVQFKGSGWYVTDYARKSAPSANAGKKKDKPSEPKSESPAKSSSNETKK